MTSLTRIIQKIKTDSNDITKKDINSHIFDIKSLFFSNPSDIKREQKIECLKQL